MCYEKNGELVFRKQNLNSYELNERLRKHPDAVPAMDLWGTIKFDYEHNKLVRAVLPTMECLSYEYNHNSPMPIKIYRDRQLLWECRWRADMAPLQLINWHDGLTYTWIYNNNADPLPVRLHIQGDAIERLNMASGKWGRDAERFLVAYDQVGTFRALINCNGRVVKRMDYDSFGNVLKDTLPEFFMPQGFAGGMVDPFTGLVKFGYRYYDPKVGRFTSKDPARDLRGDGDLYDYCVDDPIGRVDRNGRFWWFIPVALAGGAAIAGLGSWGAAKTADSIQSYRTGEDSDDAVEGLKKVAPTVAQTVAGAKVGVGTSLLSTPVSRGASLLASKATTASRAAASRVTERTSAARSWVTSKASQATDKIVPFTARHQKNIDRTLDVGQGYLMQGPPPATGAGYAGAGASWLRSNYKKFGPPESMLDQNGIYQRK